MNSSKTGLHRNNKHRLGYKFKELITHLPELEDVLIQKENLELTIDFSDARSIYLLNKALLADYQIDFWKLPKGYLCPGVPGRADYLHHLHDIARPKNPRGRNVTILDIGTGASSIYPLLVHSIFGFSVIASDVDPLAIEYATDNVLKNQLEHAIQVRHQKAKEKYFEGIVFKGEMIDFTICNPPFFKNQKEAITANQRKNRNLHGKHLQANNFQGMSHELWVDGGEKTFVQAMIEESAEFSQQIHWFSSLISNKDNIPFLKRELKKCRATDLRVIEMQQGKKKVHALAWTFLSRKMQLLWSEARW